ncbi:conjugative transposon protein TraJ [Mucilaginibacter paludis]|uniref:Conjugative transposon TraJ protein n=1 Tax=Mucilaginibacter paludis DSM 18603 TaxID=714943 RepID=H1YAG7_9SPHI|nr:conjugative transposon protein TraJ [Mucilaginibacter paludis]EHQ27010.1 conjugative transposon TraJ protein [Mucilaginibacter paludis DSM 18603]
MAKWKGAAILAVVGMVMPQLCHAGVADSIHDLQSVLDQLYDDMIPLCGNMIAVGQGIAGFAALWYIAFRVWKHIANAEPIDFYPLFRPFAVGLAIILFPFVLNIINSVLKPTITATENMVGDSNRAMNRMLDNSSDTASVEGAGTGMGSDPDKWYRYTHPGTGTASPAVKNTNPIAVQVSGWGLKSMIKRLIAEFLNVLYQAAALCIDTIRTFELIVLAILGPLVFGLSVFDGFQHSLKQWLARYINVYMWLPVANIFGAIISKVQENMLRLEQNGSTPFVGSSNTAYLIFMLIGICGYFTVPSIANYIMSVGGHAILKKTSSALGGAAGIMKG